MPETSFTRTISNPEVVMKRRRQQKLERRMQEFRSSDGRPDSGARGGRLGGRAREGASAVRVRARACTAGLVRLVPPRVCLVTRFSPAQLFFYGFGFWKSSRRCRRERERLGPSGTLPARALAAPVAPASSAPSPKLCCCEADPGLGSISSYVPLYFPKGKDS